ncbi:hypothetical protein G3I77_37060 [Streptomyces sp. D2-8]|uniref:hypothetical protein n=1 Tax=Streptomyces sp. D2-8 TaxID=2707767 RepID=UPI0020C13B51|nr:hypothetical protein [Streptomyces sp. D2-8]MCK8438417.1 hypothetical protein [Streptomyces sp. D2-8]
MTEQQQQQQQQTAVPAVPGVPPDAPADPVRKDRRVLRAVLRWTAAVAVFAAVGAATAYGITRMERTDVPGLATEPDGRWEYPVLTRPPLPSGSPGPFAEANTAGTHHADPRALLLPAPEGARDDKALRGSDGWPAKEDFLAEYAAKEDREELGQHLTDHGLRHIAARGWTMPDGTRTRIYLLRFDTAAVVDELLAPYLAPFGAPKFPLRGAGTSANDKTFPDEALVEDVQRVVYDEARPYGGEQVRHAYLAAGDTLALVVQSRKGGARAVPFQQTVTLQSQLLG